VRQEELVSVAVREFADDFFRARQELGRRDLPGFDLLDEVVDRGQLLRRLGGVAIELEHPDHGDQQHEIEDGGAEDFVHRDSRVAVCWNNMTPQEGHDGRHTTAPEPPCDSVLPATA
jgi:hypothetical protein